MKFADFDQLLSYWAGQTPAAPAILWEDRRVSFSELYGAVGRRASELAASGKTCLGILTDGSLECVTEIFASAKAGLQTVLLEETLPDEAIGELLRYTDADAVWSAELDRAEELSDALSGGVAHGAGQVLFFTSGTTERSKAVVLTEQSLCASAWNGSQMLPLERTDTLMCMLPLNHVFGFVCGLLWGLSCGAAVALGRGARHYADDCTHYKPTALSAVPTLLGFLLQRGLLNSELRLVLIGAGSCPPALIDLARSRGLRVSFGYGLTETSSGVAISTSGDPYAMDVCPEDVITLAEDGEILIQAPTCVMRGYYKRPEDTAAVLTGGVLRTGDLGRFDEQGKLHIAGRKKDILVLPNGTKLFLPEMEAALSAAVGTAELAVTAGKEGPEMLIQADPGEEAALWEKLRPVMETLPRGQQLRRIRFTNAPMPRTATGKIRRWELNKEDEQ